MTKTKAAPIAYDREAWGPGPWASEPDRFEFEHKGLPCLVLRAYLGSWCGYVAVKPGHPLHGISYNHGPEELLDVHGGITYSGFCRDHICHVPKPGEPDNVFWFGFDCAHAFDVVPGLRRKRFPDGSIKECDLGFGGVYRDMEYVKAATLELAEQLARIGEPKRTKGGL